MNKYRFITLIALVSFSCSQSKTESYEVTYPKTLEKTGQIILSLDSVSIDISDNIQYIQNNQEEYLAYFNDITSSIQVYSFIEKRKISTIPISTEGPNAIIGINGAPGNFYMHAPDSIFIYSDLKSTVYLIDSTGQIKTQYQVKSQAISEEFPSFDFTTFSKMWVNGNKLYLTAALSWFKDAKPPISYINLDSREHVFYADKLKIYEQYELLKIGTRFLFQSTNTVNSENQMIISFPIDHRLVFLDEEFNISYKELPNPKLGELKVYGKDMREVDIQSEKYGDFQLTVGHYHAILFDKANQLLFRIARLPESVTELKIMQSKGETRGYRYSLMAYNSNNTPLGELVIDATQYDMRMIFCGNKGLYLKKFTGNEDELVFDLFTLTDL